MLKNRHLKRCSLAEEPNTLQMYVREQSLIASVQLVKKRTTFCAFINGNLLTMKKRIIIILLSMIICLITPVTLLVIGFCSPSQFSATYYAELSDMYDRLCNVKGKKIVIIGSSSVAFGVDSALIERELALASEEYNVVNFGLYGALGTKIMLDLSENEIGEGDVVIFTPEPDLLAMSTYFSAKDMWYAVDEDFSLLKGIKDENRAQMVGGFVNYAVKKYECLSSQPASASGVYAHDSFDERCDLKNYERPYNMMSGGYDANELIELSPSIISEEFIEYVNDYCRKMEGKGAKVYFSFAPVNAKSLLSSDEDIERYCDFILNNFHCPIISNPFHYVMDAEWFYDSNFHLNDAGMTVRTIQLINDIKNCLGISFPTSVEMPQKPEMPNSSVIGNGDNSFIDYFEYELRDGEYVITAMLPSAKELSYVIVPYSYNGKVITAFEADVFADNTALSEIVIQENINFLHDKSFHGCSSLKKLVLKQSDPTRIRVGRQLLSGAETCKIHVPEGAGSAYVSNYFWSHYAENFVI